MYKASNILLKVSIKARNPSIIAIAAAIAAAIATTIIPIMANVSGIASTNIDTIGSTILSDIFITTFSISIIAGIIGLNSGKAAAPLRTIIKAFNTTITAAIMATTVDSSSRFSPIVLIKAFIVSPFSII